MVHGTILAIDTMFFDLDANVHVNKASSNNQMNAIGDSTRYVVFNSTLLKQLLMLSSLGCITQKKLTLPKNVCMYGVSNSNHI